MASGLTYFAFVEDFKTAVGISSRRDLTEIMLFKVMKAYLSCPNRAISTCKLIILCQGVYFPECDIWTVRSQPKVSLIALLIRRTVAIKA